MTASTATYSVTNLWHKNSPKLTQAQQQWLVRIHKTPIYKPLWPSLRYSLVPTLIPSIPLIVFPANELHADNAAIVGAGCNVKFDFLYHTVMGFPGDVFCSPRDPDFFYTQTPVKINPQR